jgi:hypothetical protein
MPDSTPFVVVYDACVLYPAPLRDLLVRLARAGFVQAKWTDDIHDEWTENLLENRPELQAADLARTRQLMNLAVRDCLVSDYEDLIPSLTLPDDDDRHVLAAAIHAGAQTIVTANEPDFPADVLDRYNIDAKHPDDFVLELIDLNAPAVAAIVHEQAADLKNPPVTAGEVLDALEINGLVQSVAALRQLI